MEALRDASSEVIAVAQGALQHLEEPSYPQRLLALADRAGQAVPEILGRRTEGGRPSRWKNAVVEARNDFATNRPRVARRGPSRPLPNRVRLPALATTAVLLLETGLPAEALRGAVQRHQEYLMFLDRARTGTAGCVRRRRSRLIEQCAIAAHLRGAVMRPPLRGGAVVGGPIGD